MASRDLADRAATAHMLGWQALHRAVGRGWLELHSGFMAAVVEWPVPAFNGVTVYGDFDPAELSAALSRIRDTGLPHSISSRPGPLDAVSRLAARFGLERQAGMPLMVSTEPPAPVRVSDLRIRALSPDENTIHAAIVAESFGAPPELALEMTPRSGLAAPGVHALVGEADGRPVTTALADVHDGSVGIHSVGTREAYRGRGYGAAVTAAIAQVGFDAGADLAFLLSTPMGRGVYERLGFRRVEHWSAWFSPMDL